MKISKDKIILVLDCIEKRSAAVGFCLNVHVTSRKAYETSSRLSRQRRSLKDRRMGQNKRMTQIMFYKKQKDKENYYLLFYFDSLGGSKQVIVFFHKHLDQLY